MSHYQVSLRIWHPLLSPEEISEALSLVPHAGWAAGSPRMLVDGTTATRTSTYWSARLLTEPQESLSDSLRRACALLRQRADFLRRIRGSGGRVEFFVGWFSGFSSGEILPHLLLRELGELEIDLALDVYGAEPSAAD